MAFLYYRQKNAINRARLEAAEKAKSLEVANAMIAGQDKERKRMAMDLHDGLAARLGTLRLSIDNASGKEVMLSTINIVLNGQRMIGEDVPLFFDRVITGNAKTPPSLTKHEMEVLQLLALGYKRKEVADKLVLSLDAVSFHCKNLFKKFDKKKMLSVITTV